MNSLEFGSRIGFLGGGQLARMMCLSAHTLGLEPWVLTANESDPAAQVCRNWIQAPEGEMESLVRFMRQVPVILFENEFIDTELLRLAASQVREHEVVFMPGLDVFYELQDKVRQKKLLQKLKIPTPAFEILGDEGITLGQIAQKWEESGYPFVLKWAQKGYDGKGVWLSPEPGQVSPKALQAQMKKFVEACAGQVFVESKVKFLRELALVSVRTRDGGMSFYPLVVSEQKNGICHTVQGPATRLGIGQKIETQAQGYSNQIGKALNIVGAYAIEFFLTDKNELLVNELAPRVHNSGHFSLNASVTSQFENHVRACAGFFLGSTQSAPAFAMLNVLPSSDAMPTLQAGELHLHWYGKREARAGRKMGHLNWVDWNGASPEVGIGLLGKQLLKMTL